MKPPDSQPANSEPKPKRPSRVAAAIKWLAVSVLALFVGACALLLLLVFFFPSDLAKRQLETQLSELLQGTVRAQSLSINPLTGLVLQDVDVQKGGKTLLALKRMALGYSLVALFERRIQVDEIRLEGLDIGLDLENLTDGPVEEVQGPSERPTRPTPSTVPSLPVDVALNTLVISDSNFDVDVDANLALQIRDLDLDVSLSVHEDVVTMKGALEAEEIGALVEGRSISMPLSMALDINADLQRQRLHIEKLVLAAANLMQMALSGQIADFMTQPAIDLTVAESTIALTHVVNKADAFLPAEYKNMVLGGELSPRVKVNGVLADTGFEGIVRLDLKGRGIAADIPSFPAGLRGADLAMTVSDISLAANVPQKLNYTLRLTTEDVWYEDHHLNGMDLALDGGLVDQDEISAKLDVAGTAELPPMAVTTLSRLPIKIKLDALGNGSSRTLALNSMSINLGDLLAVTALGGVQPAESIADGMDFEVSGKLEPRIENILPLLSKRVLAGVNVMKTVSADVIDIKVKGTVDETYQPIAAQLSVDAAVHDLAVSMDELLLSKRLDEVRVGVSTRFDGRQNRYSGTVTSKADLSRIHYGDAVRISEGVVMFHSTFDGSVSDAFDPLALATRDEVNATLKGINYDNASLKAAVDEMNLSLTARNDIFRERYTLDKLTLHSGKLFELSASGGYRGSDGRVALNLSTPAIDLGATRQTIYRSSHQAIDELKLNGTAAFTLRLQGRLPSAEDIDTMRLPLEGDVSLSFNGVDAGSLGYQVKDATGLLNVRHEPGVVPKVDALLELSIDETALPPELPLAKVNSVEAEAAVSMLNFDEFNVERAQFATEGAKLEVTGAVSGLRGFVGAKPLDPALALERTYARLDSDAAVELSDLDALLSPLGLKAKGRATVNASLLKKAQGPIEAKFNLNSSHVDLEQSGLGIADIDGSVHARKRWVWGTPEDQRSQPIERFKPSALLSALGSLAGRRERITIRELDLGLIKASNVSATVSFEQDTLYIQNVVMNMLSGGVGASLKIAIRDELGLSARLEAAGLDLNQLLDSERRIGGDSTLDAIVDLSLIIDQQSGLIDFNRTETTLYITHIGKEALDRLLVFIDPEGSNPTIVDARAKIKLANPARVTVSMTKGALALEIEFSEGLLSTFKIDRVPVGKVKSLQNITREIPAWDTLVEVVAVIGSRGYQFDSDGQLVLH